MNGRIEVKPDGKDFRVAINGKYAGKVLIRINSDGTCCQRSDDDLHAVLYGLDRRIAPGVIQRINSLIPGGGSA